MVDYSGLGYNQNLLADDSILLNNQNFFTSYSFDQNFQRAVINTAQLVGSAVTNAKIENLAAGKITAGTITISVSVGNSNVLLDGANNRIVINDGTTNRIVIGSI